MTKREKNLLITKFMGGYNPYNSYYDWNPLMDVIEKINEIYNQADEELLNLIESANHNILNYKICGPSLELVYDAVVDFILWYNNLETCSA